MLRPGRHGRDRGGVAGNGIGGGGVDGLSECAGDHRDPGFPEGADRGTDLLRVEAALPRRQERLPYVTLEQRDVARRGIAREHLHALELVEHLGERDSQLVQQRADVEKTEVDLNVVAVGLEPANQVEILEPAHERRVGAQLGEPAFELGPGDPAPDPCLAERALDTEERTEVAAGFPRVGQLANGGQRVPARLQVGDQPQPCDVRVVVDADAPLDDRRREQPPLLIQPDGRDLRGRRARQLVDGESGRGHRPRIPVHAHISLTIKYFTSKYYRMSRRGRRGADPESRGAIAAALWVYSVGWGTLLAVVGVLLFLTGSVLTSSGDTGPIVDLIVVWAVIAIVLGGGLGLVVGQIVGVVLALLVTLSPRRSRVAIVSAAIPLVAMAVSETATLLMFGQAPGATTFIALDAVLTLVGAAWICRRYRLLEDRLANRPVH